MPVDILSPSPPATGGMTATSSPSRSDVVAGAYSRLTANRADPITAASAGNLATTSRTRSSTVAFAGRSISKRSVPTRSRWAAKKRTRTRNQISRRLLESYSTGRNDQLLSLGKAVRIGQAVRLDNGVWGDPKKPRDVVYRVAGLHDVYDLGRCRRRRGRRSKYRG